VILRDTYGAKAYNEETLEIMLGSNSSRTMQVTIAVFVVVVVLSIAIVGCVLCLLICTKSHENSELQKKLKKNKSVVFALAVLSFVANFYILCLACTALDYWLHKGEAEIRDLFHKNNEFERSISFPLGFSLLIDILCFLLWIGIVALGAYKNSNADYILILSLTVLCPIFCIIAHFPYIAIAYLDDGYHASSIFIYYSILSYVIFGLLWLFFHWCEKFEDKVNKHRTITLIFLIIVILLFFGLVITITCYFVLIPINKSISDAPNRIVSIYQSGGFIIGSFIVYKIVKYFYRKKKDAITIEHIHEILKENFPDPLSFQQQLDQLHQQYNQFQLELQSTPQRYQVQVQNLQQQFYKSKQRLEQDLFQQRGPQGHAQQQQQNHIQLQEQSQANCNPEQTLHDLQQSLHNIQQQFYQILSQPPPTAPQRLPVQPPMAYYDV
jgi:hypothetical protein